MFDRASHLRLKIRNLEARILNAADRGDEYHFDLWSTLLEKLQAELAAEG